MNINLNLAKNKVANNNIIDNNSNLNNNNYNMKYIKQNIEKKRI